MTAQIIHITRNENFDDAIKIAADALQQGKLVVLPTETVYGIAVNANIPEAISALRKLKNRPEKEQFTVHLSDIEQVEKYIKGVSAPARKLAARYWPGPLTLVFPKVGEFGLGLRVVGDPITQQIIRNAGVPVVATSANLTGEPPCISGLDAFEQLGKMVDVVVDAGNAQFKDASSIVFVAKHAIFISRAGIIGEEKVINCASEKICIVSDKNTMRSHLATALLSNEIEIDATKTLGSRYFNTLTIKSAGLSAQPGAPINDEALMVLKEYKADKYVVNKLSQAFDRNMLEEADKIFVMTKIQLEIVKSYDRHLAEKVFMLDPEEKDIADPTGKSIEIIRKIARQIYDAIQLRFLKP